MSGRSPVDRLVFLVAALTCLVFLVGVPGSVHRQPWPAGDPDTIPTPAARDGALDVLVRKAESGAPLEGASVRVYWSAEGQYPLAGSARTAAAGTARLTALPRGAVWIIVDAPGRARRSTQRFLGAETERAELDLDVASRARVRVQDDQTKPLSNATVVMTGSDTLPFGGLTGADGGVTFDRLGAPPWNVRVAARGYEPVTRSGVVGDVTVTLKPLSALSILVQNEKKEPAAGATVWIAGPLLFPARQVQADSKGRALISGLEAGGYELKARLGNRVSPTEIGVPVRRGERNEVVLTVRPGRTVTVRVTDGEEDPPILVKGADVVLAEAGLSAFPLQGRTNTFGEVSLGPIADGPAVVGARAEGFVPRAAVAVPDDSSEPLRVPLLRGATIRGTVVDTSGRGIDGATIEILGTDLDGLPIAETPMLMAYRDFHFEWALGGPAPLVPAGELGVMPGPIPPIPGASAGAAALASHVATAADPWVTRWDGTFVAQPVTPGRVRALVRHPQYVEGLSESVTVGPGGEKTVRVVLSEGGSIEGRVLDPSGIPVAGARVDVRATVGTLERTTLTATDGTFAFAAVPEQVEIALARPDDLSRIILREPIRVPSGERLELELTLPNPRDPLIVTVTNAGGEPVEMAQVTALSLDPKVPLRETQFADEEGKVEFDDAKGLDLSLVIEATGYAPFEVGFPEAPAEYTAELAVGALVEGEITSVRGRRPVGGAVVTLITGGRRQVAVTDAQGRYRFEAILPGPARLVVEHPEYAEIERAVRIDEPTRADRAIELPPVDLVEAGSVEGRVLAADGTPVAGARVGVGLVPAYLPMGALPENLARTDAAGRFVLEGVPPGTVDLEAYAVDRGRGRVEAVTIEAGRTTRDVDITLHAESDDFETGSTGSVAVTLGERGRDAEQEVVVVHVAPRSEAERGGLQAGDIVLAVDDVDVTTMRAARERLGGPEGSDVLIDVERGAEIVRLRVRRERVRR